jgi:hypothetical protein
MSDRLIMGAGLTGAIGINGTAQQWGVSIKLAACIANKVSRVKEVEGIEVGTISEGICGSVRGSIATVAKPWMACPAMQRPD